MNDKTKTEPNDSAFPITTTGMWGGLTKREQLAAMAFHGILSNPSFLSSRVGDCAKLVKI